MQGAAITAALGGQAWAIISWLVATQQIYGKLTITTTAASGPSLAGNLVKALSSFHALNALGHLELLTVVLHMILVCDCNPWAA